MELNKIACALGLLLVELLATACANVNGTGYDTLTDNEKEHVKTCDRNISEIRNDGNVYKVMVAQVRNYIQQEKDIIIYEYVPFCDGESGTSPSRVAEVCNQRQVKLMVVSTVYDDLFPVKDYTFPVFVIDNGPYHTENYQKYAEQFFHELTGSDEDNRAYGFFHYFHNGNYVRSFSSLYNRPQ